MTDRYLLLALIRSPLESGSQLEDTLCNDLKTDIDSLSNDLEIGLL